MEDIGQQIPISYLRRSDGPFIYFFTDYGNIKVRKVKVGYTANNPNRRLATVISSSPNSMSCYGIIKGTFQDEAKIKKLFAPYKHHGEWYYFNEIENMLISILENKNLLKQNKTSSSLVA